MSIQILGAHFFKKMVIRLLELAALIPIRLASRKLGHYLKSIDTLQPPCCSISVTIDAQFLTSSHGFFTFRILLII